MTRDKAAEILPVLKDYVNGMDIQYWDSIWLTSKGRGYWFSGEHIGFGAAPISNYRKIKNGMCYYYDGRTPHEYTNEDNYINK